ncbi:TIC, chloroplastic-like [Raphidocelis subcapitata]|uniref:TIC, chloroplastic-like n=1 Tax=Raphidocelis subcapitata TaxID=307507 RepID=A0A2V0PCK2_9CHLO|nr:TIC, chloroplastic-like [Raphidocelis subcapitata]|eukprot:GBF97584.1 TIC, chloroplastic-like [Raphidocelis subcapitata]
MARRPASLGQARQRLALRSPGPPLLPARRVPQQQRQQQHQHQQLNQRQQQQRPGDLQARACDPPRAIRAARRGAPRLEGPRRTLRHAAPRTGGAGLAGVGRTAAVAAMALAWRPRVELTVCAGAVGDNTFSYPPPPSNYSPSSFGVSDPNVPGRLSEPARAALARAAGAMRRYGWLAFWVQLTMSTVSGTILLFSAAFTSQSGPRASLYLTLVGILAGFLSTFWAYGYQRIAARMQEFLDGADVARVKKQQVMDNIVRGVLINIAGMGSTLLGVSTLVGLLVAKTLTNASVNPFAAGAGGYNPVLALDVFLVQAATNTLLGHFASLLCSLWLLNVIGEGRGLRFQQQQQLQRLKEEEEEGVSGRSVSGSVYRMGNAGGGGGGGGGWPAASR